MSWFQYEKRASSMIDDFDLHHHAQKRFNLRYSLGTILILLAMMMGLVIVVWAAFARVGAVPSL